MQRRRPRTPAGGPMIYVVLLLLLASGSRAFHPATAGPGRQRWRVAPTLGSRRYSSPSSSLLGRRRALLRAAASDDEEEEADVGSLRLDVMDVEDESELGTAVSAGAETEQQEEEQQDAVAEEDPLAWTDAWLGSLGLSREALAQSLGGSYYNGELDLAGGDAFSSRTLRALAEAGDASQSLLTKAQGELQALGAYAASKAVADSRLLLSVGVVAAAELAALLARPLLASSSSAASSPSGRSRSTSSGAGLAPPTLSLKERVELVQAGMLTPRDLATLALGDTGLLGGGRQGRGRFGVSSFADAGNPDALLADMYARARRARGGNGLLLPPGLPLPPLPKQLEVLALPLRAVGALPSLPGAALGWLDAAKRLDVGVQTRRPTEALLQAAVRPVLPALEAWAAGMERRRREDRLLGAGFTVGKWREGAGVQQQERDRRRRFSTEEEAAILSQLGVLGARGGGAAATTTAEFASSAAPFWEEDFEEQAEGAVPTVAVSRMGKRRRSPRRRAGSALEAAAAAVSGLLWEGEEEDAATEMLQWPLCRMQSSGVGEAIPARSSSLGLGGSAAVLAATAVGMGMGMEEEEDDDDVLDARVESVSPEEERRARAAAEGAGAKVGRLLLRGTLRALDVTLLGLEFLAVEGLPVVAARARAATRRAKEAVIPPGVEVGGAVAGVKGKGRGGRDLLPVFERPMRSELMHTRRR